MPSSFGRRAGKTAFISAEGLEHEEFAYLRYDHGVVLTVGQLGGVTENTEKKKLRVTP
ncbi:MAG: hypothetical protein LBH43_03495 [Treponema sp.]|nr:hypothetical protein [Treponema sp.]